MCHLVKRDDLLLKICLSLLFPLQLVLHVAMVAGDTYCESPSDCLMIRGSTCVDKRCTCDPSIDTGLFPPCILRMTNYGDMCEVDRNCNDRDPNLICAKDLKVCKCRRGLTWDVVSTRCHTLDLDHPFINRDLVEKFDPTRDIIIPSVILMTLAATAWLCFKLFCNCGKTLRRRRRATDMTRALEEAQIPGVVPSQSTTWVASYRGTWLVLDLFRINCGVGTVSLQSLWLLYMVQSMDGNSDSVPTPPTPWQEWSGLQRESMEVFGPMNSVDSRNFPPCLLLPTGPPPYEEALKHKVILSSYTAPQPSNQQVDHAQL